MCKALDRIKETFGKFVDPRIVTNLLDPAGGKEPRVAAFPNELVIGRPHLAWGRKSWRCTKSGANRPTTRMFRRALVGLRSHFTINARFHENRTNQPTVWSS
jgi:hypothetical protein